MLAARQLAESIVESLPTPLLVLRNDLTVRTANRAFCRLYGLQPCEVESQALYNLRGGLWSALRGAVEQVARDGNSVENLELEQEIGGLGRRIVCISALTVQAEGERQVLLAIEDITARKQAERILYHQRQQLQRSVETSAAELEQSREELRALTASLLHTQEEERRWVSRELHDDLSQKIAKLQFDVETLEQQLPPNLDHVKQRLLTVRDEVARLSNDIRRIAHQLHPSTLDHLGLSVALRSYARDFAGREGVEVKFRARNVPPGIPPDVATSLYRVLQEALRNVAKHAGQARVAITLIGRQTKLCLTIRDYGVGFDAAAVQGTDGLGLISMQERVRLVRGTFTLKTDLGKGTMIRIQVPLT